MTDSFREYPRWVHAPGTVPGKKSKLVRDEAEEAEVMASWGHVDATAPAAPNALLNAIASAGPPATAAIGVPAGPTIYDITIDEVRPATQKDFDDRDAFSQAGSELYRALRRHRVAEPLPADLDAALNDYIKVGIDRFGWEPSSDVAAATAWGEAPTKPALTIPLVPPPIVHDITIDAERPVTQKDVDDMQAEIRRLLAIIAEIEARPEARPFDHDGDGKPGGASKPVDPVGELPALRAEYKLKFGKQAFMGWGADELRRRLDAEAA